MARPTHIISAIFENITLPADDIILNIDCKIGISKNAYVLIVFGLDKAPPTPSKRPAAGNIDIGNINALPNFCKFLNKTPPPEN